MSFAIQAPWYILIALTIWVVALALHSLVNALYAFVAGWQLFKNTVSVTKVPSQPTPATPPGVDPSVVTK